MRPTVSYLGNYHARLKTGSTQYQYGVLFFVADWRHGHEDTNGSQFIHERFIDWLAALNPGVATLFKS
jgi:hypothetical protein